MKINKKLKIPTPQQVFTKISGNTTRPYEIIGKGAIPLAPSDFVQGQVPSQPIPPDPVVVAGPTGPIGFQGSQGPAGSGDGSGGVTGATGPQGLPGAQGAVGPIGPAGVPGNQGPEGPTGFQGVQGFQGSGTIEALSDGTTTIAGGQTLSIIGSTGISVSLKLQSGIPTYDVGEIGWQRGGELFPQTLGGIVAGSSFDQGTSINTILETLLFPYQEVSFSAFSIGIAGSPFEVGQTAGNSSANATWSTSGPTSNWVPGSINISANQSIGNLASGLNYNSSPYSISHGAYRYETRTNLTFTITGQQVQGNNPSRSQTLSWNYRYYAGKTAEGFTGLDLESQGFASTTNRTSPINWQITFSGSDNKAYFIIPNPDYSGTLKFTDTGTNLEFPFNSPKALTHTNVHGTEVSYSIYESFNNFSGTRTIKVEQV